MKSLFIAGLILFVGSIFLIPFNYEKFNVDKNGIIVKMRIEKLPSSCIGAKVPYFVSFSYNGEIYDKATQGDFCDKHHVGEMIEIKWLNGSKYILWPNEWIDEFNIIRSFRIFGVNNFCNSVEENESLELTVVKLTPYAHNMAFTLCVMPGRHRNLKLTARND